ncbi:MAG: SurA N-terminal domain-containing protein, partial [Desulfovibrionaceae bacterium]|nr:SurA N-terminal domain-containing protein [Desulfovibrionaceae bacterium]
MNHCARSRLSCMLLLLFACCLLLVSCLESRLPEGVVATVNGEAIHLRTVQALLDSRSGALGMLRRPTLANLKHLYGDALGTLIVQALVRQELGRRHLQVSDAELREAVDEVRKDYGQEEFAAHLTELSLDELQWEYLMR